ncbi:inorganic diphosphatase [Candidatus Bathyarchaeota archaeon]|nr:inorganic diphosphatase [Candidatus Bathyarchaeota archaeon]MBL7169063.1 inorganic diphosphatase [Candidatus Bathyarchaeota archaeon]
MADLWRDFASGPDPPEEVYVVIEMTRGSRNKYEYDARNGVFRLNRVLYTYFPCDYGFIPQTLDDDGDPLDAVLLINEPTFTGCVTVARPVANIKMIDGDAMDDKIVTVSTTDPFYKHVRSLDDIPPSLVRELTYFFENYKRAEDKTTKVERWDDSDEAKKIIEWSMDYYKKNAET